MSKAVCTECGAVIEIDGSKAATICPKCGNAIVTAQAIEKYKEGAAKGGTAPDGLSTLIENYTAYLKLYDINFQEALKPHFMGAEMLRMLKEVEQLIKQYEAAYANEVKQVKKHNRRVTVIKEADELTGLGRFFGKQAQKWIGKAKDSVNSAAGDTKKLEYAIEEKQKKIEALRDEQHKVEEEMHKNGGMLYYNTQASRVAEEICSKFPARPEGYICKADHAMHEVLWRIDMYKFAVANYPQDKELMEEIARVAAEDFKVDDIKAEIKKAEIFMKGSDDKACVSAIKKLKKFVEDIEGGGALKEIALLTSPAEPPEAAPTQDPPKKIKMKFKK